MKNQSVVVFVADEEKSQKLTTDTNLVVFGSTTFRNALSQVIFSYPDVVILDAGSDMLRAEDTFFHLRTINHPPIIVLSDVVGRWEMAKKGNPVIVISEDSTPYQIEETVRALLAGNIKAVS